MANIKFSGFTEVTSIAAVQEIVGYNGTQNVRITPANLVNTVLPGGPFLPLTGGIMTGNTIHNDNVKSIYGTASDGLEVFHDGLNSYIQDSGTGVLFVTTNSFSLKNSLANESMITALENNGVFLYYNNTLKFATTNTGISVTGDVIVTDSFASVNLESSTGTNQVQIKLLNTGGSAFFGRDNSSGSWFGTGEAYATTLRSDGAYPMIFRVNGGNKLTIDSSGNSTFAGNVTLNGAGDPILDIYRDSGGNHSIRLHSEGVSWINNNNNFGIGTDSPGNFTGLSFTDTILDVAGILQSRVGNISLGGSVYRKAALFTSTGTADPYLSFNVSSSGTSSSTVERMRIASDGAIKFNSYGAGTFTGTLAKTLGVTSAGDVIEYVPPVSVVGNNSIYVAPVGTLAENGAALLAGYTAAVTKIGSDSQPGGFLALGFPAFAPGAVGNTNWLGIGNTAILFAPGPVYQAPWGSPSGTQVLIQVTSVGSFGASSFQFTITNLDGSPFTATGTSFSEPNLSVPVPSCLIIAPGSYEIASDLVINELVSVTSLTGQPDVIITGGNVQVRAGANDVAYRISITGLYTKMSIFTESSLNYITFKNCIGQGTNSFGFDPAAGDGINSGSYIECVGGEKSFGGGIGNVAAGVYTRCVAAGEWGFGGLAKTTGAFMNCGSQDPGFFIFPIDPNAAPASKPAKMFGGQGTRIGGFFDGCIGGYGAFGFQNTIDITARFTNCSGGNESFGCRSTGNSGQYYNCTVGTIGGGGRQGFGCNPQGGDTATGAYYYNCSADVIASNADIGSKFMNCHATPNTSNIFSSNWSNYNCSDNGIAYNCSFGSGNTSATQPTVSGTGKIRNCLAGGSNQFTIVNLG